MDIQIKNIKENFTINLDEDDVLKFVGVSLCKTSHGYLRVNHKGYDKDRYVHRMVMNAKKNDIVDHINGNKLDNRKSNLRICSVAENCLNKKNRKDNISGYSGVYYDSKREKWAVQISVHNKTISIGRFDYKNDAIDARLNAEKKYHGKFSSHNGVLNEKQI